MMLSSVIPPVIIPEKGQSVNENSANIADNAQSAGNSTHVNPATTVPVKFCASFNPDPHANEWTVLRMAMQWIGEELITLNGDIFSHESEDEKAKELVFAKLDDRRVRVIISQPLLQAIQNRSTYNLLTHNGEIRFVNGREFTFRAHTQKDGKHVIQERKSKTRWTTLGTITPDGTVALTPNLKKDADTGAPYALKIATKVKMLNNPERAIDSGVSISFTGKCRRCNRKLSDPKSVAEGVGSVCRGKEVKAAIAQPVVHIELPHTGAVISTLEALPITAIVPAQRIGAHIPQIHINTGSAPLLPAPAMALLSAADVSLPCRDMAAEELIMRGLPQFVIEDMLNELAAEGLLDFGNAAPMYAKINERFGIHETLEMDSKSEVYQRRNVEVLEVENSIEWGVSPAEKQMITNLVESASRPSLPFNEAWDPKTGKQPVMPIHPTPEPFLPQELDKMVEAHRLTPRFPTSWQRPQSTVTIRHPETNIAMPTK